MSQPSKTFPTVLEGTVFRPKTITGPSGKEFIAFSLAVYAGKDREGNFRKGPSVDVALSTAASEAFGLPKEKDRVRVSGFLEERPYNRKDGSPAVGLSLSALEIEPVVFQGGEGHGGGSRPAPAPASKPTGSSNSSYLEQDVPF